MAKTLIGLVTFGNLEFTKLAIKSVKETSSYDVDFFVVVGKPKDMETVDWLVKEKIDFVLHTRNWGFPFSVNDLYEYAWVKNDYDNLILMGNDIICYPTAIDSLIGLADKSEYLVISGLQYDVRDLVREFPDTQKYFSTGTYRITDFSAEPWYEFQGWEEEENIADMQLYDIQNLCLYKKEAFEIIGYTDVNFYPAYYIDNDYARRIVNSKMKCCSLTNARFFHFWSRTLHQGEGGSNPTFFERNRRYYIHKWGGDFGQETKEASIKIGSRKDELKQLKRWMK